MDIEVKKTPAQIVLECAKAGGIQAFGNDNIYEALFTTGITTDDLMPGVEKAVEGLLDALAIDWRNDHNSRDTPRRLAKMYLKETLSGRYEAPPEITEFPNVSNSDSLIVCRRIRVESLCSHHHQNIRGWVYIGVLPDPEGNVMGLSKFSRIVRHISRRPQIQEEMVVQIANYVHNVIKPLGTIVLIEAEHQCMSVRGVSEPDCTTANTHLIGEFYESPTLKDEFYRMIENARR